MHKTSLKEPQSPKCCPSRQHKVDPTRAENFELKLAGLAKHVSATSVENIHHHRKPQHLDEYVSIAKAIANNPAELDIEGLRATLRRLLKPPCRFCTFTTWRVPKRQGNGVMRLMYMNVATTEELQSLLKQAKRAQKKDTAVPKGNTNMEFEASI